MSVEHIWAIRLKSRDLQLRNRALRHVRLVAAREKATHTQEQWRAMLVEFNFSCVRCGETGLHLDKDHIVPLYQGGSDGIDNLQPLCARCNAGKGSDSFNWAKFRREQNLLCPSDS